MRVSLDLHRPDFSLNEPRIGLETRRVTVEGNLALVSYYYRPPDADVACSVAGGPAHGSVPRIDSKLLLMSLK